MSTLKVNTIQDASAGNSMPVADINQGRAKAWLNMNGTGTIAVRDSFNIASLIDNGAGDYAANLSSAMQNANGSVSTSADNTTSIAFVAARVTLNSRFALATVLGSAPTTLVDVTQISSSVDGD